MQVRYSTVHIPCMCIYPCLYIGYLYEKRPSNSLFSLYEVLASVKKQVSKD